MLRELTIDELDAVAGGMMNDGRGQLDPKAPGALPAPYTNGGPPDKPFATYARLHTSA
jgi:hypothetical protein